MAEEKTVITLMCERAADVNGIVTKDGECTSVPGVKVVKLPCSGMVQTLMIEAAMKAGASGVIVCGCQIGDCYYREGNKMIRERLLGERPPGLKKTVDRRRVMALWLSRLQRGRFETEAKEFVAYVSKLDGDTKVAAKIEGAKAAPAAAPAAKIETPAKPAEKVEAKEAKAEEKPKEAAAAPEAKESAKDDAKATGTDSGAQNAAGAAIKAEESAEKKADAKKAAADDAGVENKSSE